MLTWFSTSYLFLAHEAFLFNLISFIFMMRNLFSRGIAIAAHLICTIQFDYVFALTENLPSKKARKAIVVGGGPVGLATALTLANAPHFYDVSLFEASTPTEYDPTKAYQYLINRRGLRFVERFEFLERLLKENSVKSGSATKLTYVPADKTKPLPKQKDAASPTGGKAKEEDFKAAYWIPRHTMTTIMRETVDDWNKHESDQKGKIDVYNGNVFLSLDGKHESKITVKVKDTLTKEVHIHDANLVVGADGINSKVRECLATDKKAFSTWDKINHKKFIPKKWVSPSSGLRIKALQFPPEFKIPNNDNTFLTTKGTNMYVMLSRNKGTKNKIRLGTLPMQDETAIRPINIVTRPDHDIWNIKDGKEMQQWFQNSFPRLNFGDTSDLVSSEEWERFAKADGSSFPPCQYTPGLQVNSNNGKCGVVLVGDSVHAFPPDIGQGVNAGLEDVTVLDEALRSDQNDNKSLGSRLEQYEKQRLPDVKGLIRFSRFGYPYQYRQSHKIDQIRRTMHIMNVLSKSILNKISFGLIPKASIMYFDKYDWSYGQIMRRADAGTAGLTLTLCLCIFQVIRRIL